jgi:hypothetical protein
MGNLFLEIKKINLYIHKNVFLKKILQSDNFIYSFKTHNHK